MLSVAQLWLMLNICSELAVTKDLNFNHKESHLIETGPLFGQTFSSLTLGRGKFEWINEVKHLGVIFNAGKNYI